ncbi:MAG: 3-phosphoshikimate 1-carboxyvinyltransferase [candidate division KSB1 bacterium]|nr:3-phosphoshikimate 1-carboxyvinyltransferase [candidate division KSB1 bacterium]MDZ7318646.1 3-phosphoshikimate 1-carboxyvinyltransferase [candidate division KSB1 bacterium]MDZ7340025.1 3-phosphoshikimate 1-carboxyvinyltransferase [candidate division KSB1 bacterium]
MIYKIDAAKTVTGSLAVPGDKSISHRALMLGAIADERTIVQNLSPAADVRSTMNCLQQLHAAIHEYEGAIVIDGQGLYGLQPADGPLDCGNSGTTMRLLAGILAAQPFSATLIGDASLSRRPMKRIMDPLAQMGAKIQSQPGGLAPLVITGDRLHPIRFHSPVASAQVKSCVLLAGLYAEGITSVVEPHLSRDHSERMLTDFGVQLVRNGFEVALQGPARLAGHHIHVPGDFSSAAFFIGAALITPASRITIRQVGLNPTRTGLLDVLQEMGARVDVQQYPNSASEPMGELTAQTSNLSGVDIPPEIVPRLIDEIPILAIIATQARGRTTISGARELRVKESDRLHAVATNLAAMGVRVTEKDDGLVIDGPQRLLGATVDSYGDHRLAMAFAIAGLIGRGQTQIAGAESVAVSMPNFFDALKEVTDG